MSRSAARSRSRSPTVSTLAHPRTPASCGSSPRRSAVWPTGGRSWEFRSLAAIELLQRDRRHADPGRTAAVGSPAAATVAAAGY
jgi:hypothetical protein